MDENYFGESCYREYKSDYHDKRPFFESFISGIIQQAKGNVLEVIRERVQEKIKKIKQKLMRFVLALTFSITGIFFVLISAAFFIHDYFRASYATSFFIIGIIMLFVAFIAYLMFNSN